MTKQEALDLIKLRLGSRDDSDLDALIAAELSVSQTELEATDPYPWFCQQVDSGRQLTIGNHELALPADFVIELDEQVVEISEDGILYTPIDKKTYDDIRSVYASAAAGSPKHYALVGKKLYFGPAPDKAYYIRFNYQGRDVNVSTLASGDTNEWLTEANDYLGAHAGLSVASWVKDNGAMQLFAAKLAAAQQRIRTHNTAREEANRGRNMED